MGGDPLPTLRVLEPGLPLPRLINGLPAFIQSRDRKLIKEGHRGIIIFWSSLFSIYRVLKGPYKLKTATITDPFTGDNHQLDSLIIWIRENGSCFEPLKGFSD
jgi:hypothetical protein